MAQHCRRVTHPECFAIEGRRFDELSDRVPLLLRYAPPALTHIVYYDPAPPAAFDWVSGSMPPHIPLNFDMMRSPISDGGQDLIHPGRCNGRFRIDKTCDADTDRVVLK
jgi:hypothetical protein